MKADISLEERNGIAREEQAEIRAALVRRHVEVLDEQFAIGAAQIALDIRHEPVFRKLSEQMRG